MPNEHTGPINPHYVGLWSERDEQTGAYSCYAPSLDSIYKKVLSCLLCTYSVTSAGGNTLPCIIESLPTTHMPLHALRCSLLKLSFVWVCAKLVACVNVLAMPSPLSLWHKRTHQCINLTINLPYVQVHQYAFLTKDIAPWCAARGLRCSQGRLYTTSAFCLQFDCLMRAI